MAEEASVTPAPVTVVESPVTEPADAISDSAAEPIAEPAVAESAETAAAPIAEAPTKALSRAAAPEAEPSAALRFTGPTPAETEQLALTRSVIRATPKTAEPELASLRIPRITPPPLRGSRESLIRQNEKTEAEGLERIEDAADLRDRIAHKLLVPVPASAALAVNANLPEQYRYCRPWTATFLADLARAHDAVFHRPVMVSSAVRTIEYQRQLERVNGNAAPAEGDIVSPHLTGGTIDIAKGEFTRQEIAWMRAWLKPLQTAGKIDVEEEFLQACFHITVYQNYVPPPAPARKPRPRRRTPSVANALAAKVM